MLAAHIQPPAAQAPDANRAGWASSTPEATRNANGHMPTNLGGLSIPGIPQEMLTQAVASVPGQLAAAAHNGVAADAAIQQMNPLAFNGIQTTTTAPAQMVGMGEVIPFPQQQRSTQALPAQPQAPQPQVDNNPMIASMLAGMGSSPAQIARIMQGTQPQPQQPQVPQTPGPAAWHAPTAAMPGAVGAPQQPSAQAQQSSLERSIAQLVALQTQQYTAQIAAQQQAAALAAQQQAAAQRNAVYSDAYRTEMITSWGARRGDPIAEARFDRELRDWEMQQGLAAQQQQIEAVSQQIQQFQQQQQAERMVEQFRGQVRQTTAAYNLQPQQAEWVERTAARAVMAGVPPRQALADALFPFRAQQPQPQQFSPYGQQQPFAPSLSPQQMQALYALNQGYGAPARQAGPSVSSAPSLEQLDRMMIQFASGR